ncbi:MAG: glutamyl-tRNA amidotransferase [Rhodobacteraceae bacterium]|nr:MAG: glutamyl-tRNA amidotransferase [Paracoccaceae bacterium]|tara:strand:- start:1716 stop:2174 length:459 start_codon:yes stop_codon:yes gene_type:complete
MREQLTHSLKAAMKARDTQRISTIRLINAAIKDRDIAVRSEENVKGVTDEEILSILAKMIKQRQESAKQYEEAGRIELAEQELSEIGIIETFLPKQMTENEMIETVDQTIQEIKADSIRDMGKVMGVLKQKHAGIMDFSRAGARAKEVLSKK